MSVPAAAAPEPAEAGARLDAAAIVVTHNGEACIETCLDSLRRSHDHGLQIVVFDNASTDATVAIVRTRFPHVEVIESDTNVGYGAAINRAAQPLQREFLAILNQDTTSSPGWIPALIGVLEEDPTAALATPKILLHRRRDRVNTCGVHLHVTGITTCRGYGAAADAFLARHEVGAVSGAAFVARRTVFRALGGFDPEYFLYLEDSDLSLRARLAGYTCVCEPAALVWHDFRPALSPTKIYWLERNRQLTLLKTFRWRTLVALAPVLLAVELATWAFCAVRGPAALASKGRAILWILRHVAIINRVRRRTQRLRAIGDAAVLRALSSDLDLTQIDGRLATLATRLLNPLLRGWTSLVLRLVG